MSGPREQTCCFTGHRKIPATETQVIKKQAEQYIRVLYNKGVRLFRVGGAMGFDTEMAQLLFLLRSSDITDIKVSLYYPFDGFTAGWTDEQIALYDILLSQYDEVLRISEKAGKDAYLERDRALVVGSEYCITYCRDITARSGTAYTVRYAKKKGLQVFNIATALPSS